MIKRLILAISSLCLFAACATTGGGVSGNSDILAEEIARMQTSLADLQVAVEELSIKNEGLASEVAQNADATVELQAESAYLRNEMMLQHGGAAPTEVSETEQPQTTAAGVDNTTPAKPATAQQPPKIVIIEDVQSMRDSLYSYAYELHRQGKYTESITKFQEFIAKMPNDDLADNSQYWIGESYYSMRDYNKALEAFKVVTTKYPQGGKVPDAMLKIGYTYDALKQKDNAKSTLEQLVKQYPRSSSANLAKQMLAKW
ncbi:MAG: tol-pal system protein YbgF [Deferribacteraceae bacterium]|jgi:tol-pal system protein YbgF|nr:tol-pal system protein YbgF [Deferribacteraceae bacterium]